MAPDAACLAWAQLQPLEEVRSHTYVEGMENKSSIVHLKLRRAGPVLVCKKCLRRVDDGGKLKRRLKSELKQRSAVQRTKRPRLVLANCFGICPRRAVVMASPHTFRRGEFVLLSDSTSGSIGNAAAALMPNEGGSVIE
jgi:hypothetical protein